MLGRRRKGPDHLQAIDRVREWTRARFALPSDSTIIVAQLECRRPGCPPLETVVVFWCATGTQHRFKVFKRAVEVAQEDIPFAWLREALVVDDELDFACC